MDRGFKSIAQLAIAHDMEARGVDGYRIEYVHYLLPASQVLTLDEPNTDYWVLWCNDSVSVESGNGGKYNLLDDTNMIQSHKHGGKTTITNQSTAGKSEIEILKVILK